MSKSELPQTKKVNKKIVDTKKKLAKSLISLLSKKSLSDIDVSELCSLAEINRTTFYKHYQSPYDVLEELIVIFFEKVNDIFVNREFSENLTSQVVILLKYIKLNRLFVSSVMKGNFLELIKNKLMSLDFINALIKKNISYKKNMFINEDYYIDFIISGWYAAIKRWVDSECDLDENTLARLLTSIY